MVYLHVSMSLRATCTVATCVLKGMIPGGWETEEKHVSCLKHEHDHEESSAAKSNFRDAS